MNSFVILPRSDCRPLAAEQKVGTKVNFSDWFTARFDNPTTAVQESGTYGAVGGDAAEQG
jgi:hypothetical protein